MNKSIFLCVAVVGGLLTSVVYADSVKLVNPDNGHNYQRFDTASTWTQAKNMCIKQGGYLATITSQAENDWVWSKFGFAPANFSARIGFFLGGTDATHEGHWRWVTGEAWSYSNWALDMGEPDNYMGKQDSLGMWDIGNGSWSDNMPYSTASYLCEWGELDTVPRLYSQVITIPDINGNGAPELALLGEQSTNYKLFVYDSLTQALLSESVIKAKKGYTLKSFSVVNDSNGNGAPEVAILINKLADKTSVLQFQDALSGDIVKTLNLPKN